MGRNDACSCGSGRKFKHCCGSGKPGPAALDALAAQGLQAQMQGDFQRAEQLYNQVLQQQPEHGDALHWLGALAHQFGRNDIAVGLISRSIKVRADAAKHFNLGLALHAMARIDEALDQYRLAVALNPAWGAAYNNMAVALLDNGVAAEAEQAFRRAIQLEPANVQAHSNLLLCRLYDPTATPAGLLNEHLEFGRRFGGPLKEALEPPVPGPRVLSRLRLGFISGDLRTHPVGLLIEGLIPALLAFPLDLFIYSNNPSDDELSARLRALPLGWRDVTGLLDEQVARQIQQDGLDVLVDLSGHSAHNRLTVFNHRPAPLQVSWLGYGATTGLPAMDAILVDRHCFDAGDAAHFTERPLVLPNSRLFFTPPPDSPTVTELPMLRNGFASFACYNNLAKLNRPVLESWARVLAAVPESRIVFKGRQFDQASCRAAMLGTLTSLGVAESRISIGGFESRQDYLKAYEAIDIALDPYPFPGGTTTLEGLWMGVPTVSLPGETLIARQGQSILRNLGMQDWIARSQQDYIDLLCGWASNPTELSTLRQGLRSRMRSSPLCDSEGFAIDLMTTLIDELGRRGARLGPELAQQLKDRRKVTGLCDFDNKA